MTFYLSINEMLSKSLNEQAELADIICKKNATDVNFCKSQLPQTIPHYNLWNGTSIANVAYLSLYGCEETRDKYRQLLDGAKSYFNSII